MSFKKKAIILYKKNRDYLLSLAEHIVFLTVTDQLEKALDVFQSHLLFSLETESPYRKLIFYRAAILFLQKMRNNQTLIRLPDSFPIQIERPTAELVLPWFCTDAKRIAEQFDQRNKNRFVSESMSQYIQKFSDQ